MTIIIGSTALKQFGLNRSEPKDIDIFFSNTDPNSEKCLYEKSGKDLHVIPDHLYNLFETKYIDGNNYLVPDHVYTLKCSHFAWDIHWEKTKLDILWLKSNECKLDEKLYHELKQYWESIHGNKDFLSLNKSKDKFFTDNVTYLYDHDYLHELVAYPNPPMYTNCLKDGAEVLIDKNKFDKLEFHDKITMFREEICVIAVERWLVHKDCKISWFQAYSKALKKTITNLTKNWANDFLIQNLEQFVKPEYKYFKHILQTLEI